MFVSVQCGLLTDLYCCGVSRGCVTVLGVNSGLFGDHWVSGSFEGAMRTPLHVLVVLLCSAQRTGRFRVACIF